jgi:hypothetical protein
MLAAGADRARADRNKVMSNLDDNVGEEWGRTKERSGGKRLGQIMSRVAQGAEAQKSAARTAEKTARYMLWTAVLAAVSTVITAAGVVFCVVVYLMRIPQ